MEYRVVRSARKSLVAEVVDGEVIVKAPFWLPKNRIEHFVQKHRATLQKRIEAFKERQTYYYLFGKRYEREGMDVEVLWMEEAKKRIVPMAWKLAQKFGDEPTSVRISRAKKRWGSCSSKGAINLSYRLAQLPWDLIEYVIIHELCHLTHLNHSKAFWQLVQERCADYKVKEKILCEF